MLTNLWNSWPIFDQLERSMFDRAGSTGWPHFDIAETETEAIITADLPGMSDEDVEVTVSGQYLSVRGERKPRQDGLVHRGRYHGVFERRFWIGDHYDPDRVEAHIANGELTIRLEKAAKAKPRRIKLGSGVAAKVKGLLGGNKDKAA